MSIPIWVTPPGTLGTIPEGVFYDIPLVATASPDRVFYRVISGNLPPGIQIDETGILSGNVFAQAQVQGVPLDVAVDTTSRFTVRAYTTVNGQYNGTVSGLADRTFSLTITNQSIVVWLTPSGNIGSYIDGVQVSGLAVQYEDNNIYATDIVTLIAGSLPPGLSISTKGVIFGYITPNPNATIVETTYSFTLKVSNGFSQDVKSFNINVFARSLITADNTVITADNTVITADTYTTIPPIITTPVGSIGSTRSDNFYAFQFTGKTYYSTAFQFIATDALPPGLTLDPNSGWLYGYIPSLGLETTKFNFSIIVAAVNNLITGASGNSTIATVTFATQTTAPYAPGDTITVAGINPVDYNGTYTVTACTVSSVSYADPTTAAYVSGGLITSNYSNPYSFSLTITGPVDSDVIWLTPSDAVERAKLVSSLGLIDNGAVSTLYVAAENISGIPLQYQLLSGSDSRLPQGLELLPSGHIVGRLSFNTFCVDGGTTTFDVRLNTVKQPTTFDMVAVFTVNAFSVNGLVNTNKTFSITVVRKYQTPFDNLYIQCMPPKDNRVYISSLLQNPDIFPPELIYRKDDPNFGIAKNVVYYHAYGLSPATLDDYVASLNLNHYWKNLVLGGIKTARALDDNGNTIYEVVYSEIIDDLVNSDGVSVGKQVTLPFPINANDSTEINVVYPNSLQDMRTQVIDTVGQVSNVLPRWMLSQQQNGSVLGFISAWIIAYTNPGQSGQIAYNIQTQFGPQLNLIDFEVDRYELDNYLTKNWNREEQQWGYRGDTITPYPPSLTYFDIFGLPPFLPTKSYRVGDIVVYQSVVTATGPHTYRDGAYRISKIYECIQNTTPGTLPTDTAYWNSNGQSLASWKNNLNVITTWEDNLQTLATWTYATPGPNNQGTTFDGNSLLFTAPVDMFSSTNTTVYDKYLVFPKRNILE